MEIISKATYLPNCTKRHVRRTLKRISPLDIAGLETLIIFDKKPFDYNDRPTYIRGFTYNGNYINDRPEGARIYLYTEDLYLGIPYVLTWTSMATLRIAYILAHEIGHHLITTRGYIYNKSEKYKQSNQYDEKKELTSDLYALQILGEMKTHWNYRFGNWLCKIFSKLYFELGFIYWHGEFYKKAARHWFNSFHLNNNEESALNYQRAKYRMNADKQ